MEASRERGNVEHVMEIEIDRVGGDSVAEPLKVSTKSPSFYVADKQLTVHHVLIDDAARRQTRGEAFR